MGRLDLNRTIAPTIIKTIRQKCHDYDGAYAYFQDRVGEMAKKTKKEGKSAYTWVKYSKSNKVWVVSISLHSMPLYWKIENAVPESTVEIKDPSGKVIETRTKIIGHTAYQVDSEEQGIEMLTHLANNEEADFKSILTVAASALAVVDDQELPHINAKAVIEFDKSEWSTKFGAWEDKDSQGKTGMVYSKEKTNKMNQFKQLARRQLGYERNKLITTSEA